MLTLISCSSSDVAHIDPVVAATISGHDLPAIPDIDPELREDCEFPDVVAIRDSKKLDRRYEAALIDCNQRRADLVEHADVVRREYGPQGSRKEGRQ